MKPRIYLGIAASAILGSVAATVANPTLGPSLMMASGAAFLAHSAVREEAQREAAIKNEATKVGSAFKYLYELNSGIVVPTQLAFHSDIHVERANTFLTQLASTQGGSMVSNENGVAVVFPHPKNIIETIERQYVSYAQSEIEKQTAQLQQQLLNLQNSLNILSATKAASTGDLSEDSQTPTDPWRKLV